MERRLAALHDKAARLAFRHYLRSGRVPQQVKDVLAATESLAAVWKYDPNQPRVPAGNPAGGQWFNPAHPPGYVDFFDPDNKPLGQVYVVEAVSGLVAWEAVTVARIVAGLATPLVTRVASARRINQAAKAIENYFGGKPDRVFPNDAGDVVLMKGDKKIRFDINNHSPHDEPHFHIERAVPEATGRSVDWIPVNKKHHYYIFSKE